MIKRKSIKFLSVLLSVLMLASVMPSSVYAIAAEDIADSLRTDESVSSDITSEEASAASSEVYALGEDVSKRTENAKYIRMSDGSYYVAMYDSAVHYLDGDVWEEIDNTLASSSASDSDDVAGVATSKGKHTIKFANNSNSSKLVAIKQGNYKISFNLVGANKSKGITVTNPEAHSDDATELERLTVVKKAVSSVIYEDILNGVDLEYVVNGNNLKENIIVKAKADEYVYQFDMKLNKLAAEQLDDGTIVLVDEKTDEVVYTITTPYMVDANRKYSDKVTYSLEQVKNKEYRITVTADSEWMNDENRAFPVTIDPPITADSSAAVDTYVYEELPNNSYSTRQYSFVGFNGTYSYYYYWKLTSLPTIPENSIITNATLSLYQNYYSGAGLTELPIVAYLPSSSWNESITWASQSHNGTALDYHLVSSNTDVSYVEWNITRAAKNWYYGATNNGILFKSNPNEDASGDISAYASFGTADRAGFEPIFTVTYRSIVGLEDYYTYHSQSIGRAGTGYICDYTSDLTLIHTDITSNSATLPFVLSHIYNEGYAGYHFTSSTHINTVDFSNMHIGNGWKLSVQETIVSKVIGDTTYYIYNDSDGTEHYISYVNGEYIDEDGLGLKLFVTNSTEGSYTLTDKQDNQKIFVRGVLSKIIDANGNTIKMVYNGTDGEPVSWGNQLQSVIRYNAGISETNAETLVTFSYDSSRYLTAVYDSIGRATYFGYTSGLLTSITKSDASVVYYEYSGNVLCDVYDSEANYGINYNTTNYTSQSSNTNAPENYKKVIGVYEYYISDTGYTTQGKKFEIENIIGQQISYWDLGNDNEYSTSDDVITTYMFDHKGRTVNVYSTDCFYRKVYGAGNVGYADNSTYAKQNNHLGSYGVTGMLPQNLLTNGSAETNDSWGNFTRSSLYAHSGLYSFSLYSSSTSGTTATLSQTLASALKYNSTFTVSAYVKVSGVTSAVSGGGVYLKAESSTETFASDPVTITGISKLDDGWQRISLTFTTANSLYFTISVCLDGAVGTVYIDDIQLEENAAPSSYNLVVPFSSNAYASTISPWVTNDSAYCYLTEYATDVVNHTAIYMHSTPYNEVYAEQTIPINKTGGTTFLVSAWAVASSVPMQFDEMFSLIATVEYSDDGSDTDETFVFPFQAEIRNAKQYISGIIVPSNSELTISNIKLKLSYSGNMGYVYFYDVSLVEEEVQTYSYDANGNLVAANQTDNAPISSMYDNLNNLTSQTQGNENYQYTYKTIGNKHLLDTVTNDGVTMSFTYDTAGNVTSTVVNAIDTSEYLASYNSYTSDGNFVSASQDTVANTTEYGYNDRNQLTAVTNARNITSYQDFDPNNDRQTVSYISGVVSVHYYYTKGMLSSLVRGGYISSGGTKYNQTYYFTYDNFGNTTSISVGNYLLVSYIYDDYNGNLLKTTYGNGNYIENVYDDLGRVVEIKINGVVKYKYSYNGNGDLYSVEDIDNGIKTNYNYDSLDRLVSSVQKIGNTVTGFTSYEYDSQSRVSEYYCGFAGVTGGTLSQTYSYAYDADDGNLTHIGVNTGNTYGDNISYTYDALKRLSVKSVSGQYRTFAQNYSYKTVSGTRTSTQISGLNVTLQGSSILSYTYSYDSLGNITSIYKDGVLVALYGYDDQGQLTGEIDYINDQQFFYSYDTYGNIRSVNKYKPSTGELLGADLYIYSNTSWLDRLESFNNAQFIYDAIGNPLSYNNGSAYTFTWQNGRELASVIKGGVTTTYKYGADGQRIEKKYGSTTYNYYYVDGLLVRQTWGTHYIDFLYDESGSPYSLIYDGVQYYYIKNVQGDVVQIRSSYGTLLVEYTYDAWGNVLSITGSYANTLGVDNPIRYRSYYYDFETGFYYLNSRYYDPAIRRFINADSATLISANNDFISCNLYVYCGNNPITRADSNGDVWITSCLIKIGIGVAKQYATDVLGNIISGKSGVDLILPTSSIGEYVAAGVTELIPGNGILNSLASNIVIESILSAERYIKGHENNFNSSVISVAEGVVTDCVVGTLVENLQKITEPFMPTNYSEFAHKQYQKNPHITQSKIKAKMRKRINLCNAINEAMDVSINILISALNE